MSLVKTLIAQFNVIVRTEYNKKYQEFEPKFKDLLFEYESGPVETVNFPFFGFLKGMEEFTGSRKHELFPEGYNFTVVNKEWDTAVDIPRKDVERASQVNSLKGLNIYRQRISEMAAIVKDHPIEMAFDMLEAGDASTYGESFDGQTFFDTTHAYGTSAGTQNNIYTGTGTSDVSLHADIIGVRSRFASFYYYQGQDSTEASRKKRKLNKQADRMLIVCPVELDGLFADLQNKTLLTDGSTNTLKGAFDYVSLHFTDTGDWYALLTGDSVFRPFLYQVELPAELDMPTMQDESARERKILSYGAYGRYNVAYGAWWKAIMIQNS